MDENLYENQTSFTSVYVTDRHIVVKRARISANVFTYLHVNAWMYDTICLGTGECMYAHVTVCI